MLNIQLAASPNQRFLDDVLAGLSRRRKRLPAKYLYDAAGSQLFDRITELPEYYLTRAELAIMRQHAAAMAARCGPHCLLVELGAGSMNKVRLLLDALDRPAGYAAVDVSREHLRQAAAVLADDYPALVVQPIIADFTDDIELSLLPARRRVVYFPGSTIGNLRPREADALFLRVVRLVGPGGGMLLGVDLRKPVDILERAYNDAEGLTAAFNKNLLLRLNRELNADFVAARFAHHAFFNQQRSRIEMHLVSDRPQQVRVGRAVFHFESGESIHTKNSYKYDVEELARRAARCGLRLDQAWMDPQNHFAVLYFSAAHPVHHETGRRAKPR